MSKESTTDNFLKNNIFHIVLILFGCVLAFGSLALHNSFYFSRLVRISIQVIGQIGVAIIVATLVEKMIKGVVTKKTKEVLQSLETLKGFIDAGIRGVYVNRRAAYERFKQLVDSASKDEVLYLSGISLRDFLYEDFRAIPAATFRNAVRNPRVKEIRLLLMNPWCRNAFYRAESEHGDYNPEETPSEAWVFRDVKGYKSFNSVHSEVTRAYYAMEDFLTNENEKLTEESKRKVQVRFYDLAEACYILATKNVLFNEQYYYSYRQSQNLPMTKAKGGIMPMFEYVNTGEPTSPYRQLMGHFQYVWSRSAPKEEWVDRYLTKEKDWESGLGYCTPTWPRCMEKL